jgi:hypothetical protein
MKNPLVPGILLLFLSAYAMGPVSTAFAATSTAPTVIPPQLLTYLEGLPPNAPTTGCVSGTIDPFSISSTTCYGPSQGPAQSLVTSCSSICQNGGYTLYTPNYGVYSGAFTAPSNPTISPAYYLPTTFSDWIGLQNCITGCGGGTAYLLQVGELWGENSSHPSNAPAVFAEFVESSGSCTNWNNNCADLGNFTVSAGDSISVSVSYYSVTNKWELYSGDTTANKYVLFYVTEGNGNYEIPLSAINHGLSISEGHGTTASNQIPGSVSIYNIEGEDTSGNFHLGNQTPINSPSSGTQSVTLSWSTSTCGSATCGTQDITVG